MRLIALLLAAFSLANSGPLALAEDRPAAPSFPAAEAVDRFAADLYGRISAGDGNLVYSPLSVHSALMMTAAGARGQTASEISAVLGAADVSSTEAQTAEGQLLRRLQNSDQDFQLHIASALWAQEGIKCLPAFQNLLQRDYRTDFIGIDFRDPLRASGAINDWVSRQTDGKISQLFSPGSLRAGARMVLANAIYFKADWQEPFSPGLTRDGEFHVAGRPKPMPASMMRVRGFFEFAQNDQFQAIELPYRGGKVSMLILLPRSIDGIGKLESLLTPEFLRAQLARGMDRGAVDVTIPKFEFDAQFDLAPKLRDMGMAAAFAPGRADFSGIDGTADLFISNVAHKAQISVDEQGTEAAAATGITMSPTAVVLSRMSFVADHPFLFLIHDRTTGAVLFLGRVEDPTVK